VVVYITPCFLTIILYFSLIHVIKYYYHPGCSAASFFFTFALLFFTFFLFFFHIFVSSALFLFFYQFILGLRIYSFFFFRHTHTLSLSLSLSVSFFLSHTNFFVLFCFSHCHFCDIIYKYNFFFSTKENPS